MPFTAQEYETCKTASQQQVREKYILGVPINGRNINIY